MNVQKSIAIVGAIAINAAALFGFHAWTAAKVASATGPSSHMSTVVTLPPIEVHPDAAELRALPQPAASAGNPQASGGGSVACVVMPYYSFASPCDATANGRGGLAGGA